MHSFILPCKNNEKLAICQLCHQTAACYNCVLLKYNANEGNCIWQPNMDQLSAAKVDDLK
jgi:hypothetical protein